MIVKSSSGNRKPNIHAQGWEKRLTGTEKEGYIKGWRSVWRRCKSQVMTLGFIKQGLQSRMEEVTVLSCSGLTSLPPSGFVLFFEAWPPAVPRMTFVK